MQRYSFAITWSELDQNYVALCPEFPGLSGLGYTPQEAIAELQVALELAVETYEGRAGPFRHHSHGLSTAANFSFGCQKVCTQRLHRRQRPRAYR